MSVDTDNGNDKIMTNKGYNKVEILTVSQVSAVSLSNVHDALKTGGVAHSPGQKDLYEEPTETEEEPG